MKHHADQQALSIGGVERDTGISKDTLRIWERRYGFPRPIRDDSGDRLYPGWQVDRLRLIKRLVDAGFRPGKLIPGSDKRLFELAAQCGQAAPAPARERGLQHAIELIRKHHGSELKSLLVQQLTRVGLQRFVVDTIAPLNVMVGESWMRGELQIFEEHLYTELALGILRNAISAAQFTGGAPRLLLTTLPNEQHSLGLAMAETILVVESADVVALGTQMPVSNIASAASAYQVDIVGLSFSGAYPANMVVRGLRDLRDALPSRIAIWAGGSGVAPIRRPIDDVTLLTSLPALQQAVHDWRAAHDLIATSA